MHFNATPPAHGDVIIAAVLRLSEKIAGSAGRGTLAKEGGHRRPVRGRSICHSVAARNSSAPRRSARLKSLSRRNLHAPFHANWFQTVPSSAVRWKHVNWTLFFHFLQLSTKFRLSEGSNGYRWRRRLRHPQVSSSYHFLFMLVLITMLVIFHIIIILIL